MQEKIAQNPAFFANKYDFSPQKSPESTLPPGDLLTYFLNLNTGVPAAASPFATTLISGRSSLLVTMRAVAVGWPAARMASRSTFSSGVPALTLAPSLVREVKPCHLDRKSVV